MYFVEVNVQRLVLNGVELRVLQYCGVFLSVDNEVNKENLGCVKEFPYFIVFYGECFGYGESVLAFSFSVHYAWHQSCAACLAGSLLA